MQVFGQCKIGSDIYFKQLRNGNNLAKFKVGWCVRSGKEKKWHNAAVTFWGKQADIAQKYLKKGGTIIIFGELIQNVYEKEGQQIDKVEIQGQRFEFVGEQQSKPATKKQAPQTEVDENEIPFDPSAGTDTVAEDEGGDNQENDDIFG